MRVAVVAEWYPSPADPVHGIWAHRQAVATAAEGVEVQVLALRRPVPPLALARRLARVPPDVRALGRWAAGVGRTLAPATLDGLRIHSVVWLGPPRPLSYATWGYWMAPSLAVALDRLSAAWPFDVLHAHCLAPAGHAATRWVARRAPERRPAFVVSGHGGDMIHLPQDSAIGRRAVLASLHRADRVLANSSWALARCEAIAGESLPIEVVHLGATLRDDRSRAHARDGGRLALVTVAHLQQRKRHGTVLEALARLDPAARPDYLVIGDGEQRAALERRTAELGLTDRVRFAGQLPNDEAVARVAESDLFVMPGIEEPFGVAFVEAMAAGVPAVGSRGEGGPRDIAAAGDGMLLVTPDDVGELAALIAGLVADRSRLRRLGDAARATAAAHFTWRRCGQATVGAYTRALAGRRA